eukprot:g2610.t1
MLLGMNKLVACWISGEHYNAEESNREFYAIRTGDHLPFLFSSVCMMLIVSKVWDVMGKALVNPLEMFETRGIAVGLMGYPSLWEIIARLSFAVGLTMVAVVAHYTAPSSEIRWLQVKISVAVLSWAYMFPILQIMLHLNAKATPVSPLPDGNYAETALVATFTRLYGLAILMYFLAPPSGRILRLLDRRTNLTGRELRRAQSRRRSRQFSLDASQRSLLSNASTLLTTAAVQQSHRLVRGRGHNGYVDADYYDDSPMFRTEFSSESNQPLIPNSDSRMLAGIQQDNDESTSNDQETGNYDDDEFQYNSEYHAKSLSQKNEYEIHDEYLEEGED